MSLIRKMKKQLALLQIVWKILRVSQGSISVTISPLQQRIRGVIVTHSLARLLAIVVPLCRRTVFPPPLDKTHDADTGIYKPSRTVDRMRKAGRDI